MVKTCAIIVTCPVARATHVCLNRAVHMLWTRPFGLSDGFKWSVNISIITITIYIPENYILSTFIDFIQLLDYEVFNLTYCVCAHVCVHAYINTHKHTHTV